MASGTWLLATLAFAGAVPCVGYADQGSDSSNLLLRNNSAGSRTRSRYAVAASSRPRDFAGGGSGSDALLGGPVLARGQQPRTDRSLALLVVPTRFTRDR